MKIHLQKLERGIIFQILEQGALVNKINIRVWHSMVKSFNLKIPNNIEVIFSTYSFPEIRISSYATGISFRSDIRPNPPDISSLSKIEIKLRGDDKSRHHDIITIPFKNNEDRNKIYDILMESFMVFKNRKNEGVVEGVVEGVGAVSYIEEMV